MDKTDKLAACPWCLGPARLTSTSNGDAGDGYMWRIACAEDNDCAVAPELYYESEELAVTRWNTRSRASVAAPPPDWLRDAGAILCVNEPDVGAKVEIRFAELADAQRLHKVLVETRANPSPVAATVDAETPVRCVHCGATEHSYQQDWDHPFESLAVAAPSSGSSIKAATARHYFCSCGGAITAEEYIEHYFEKGHDRGDPAVRFQAAAAEISSTFGLKFQEASLAQVAAIIAKHLGSAAVGEQEKN